MPVNAEKEVGQLSEPVAVMGCRPSLRCLVRLLYRRRHPVAAGRQLAEAAQALSEKKFSIHAQPT